MYLITRNIENKKITGNHKNPSIKKLENWPCQEKDEAIEVTEQEHNFLLENGLNYIYENNQIKEV